jgi:hypothetical protein
MVVVGFEFLFNRSPAWLIAMLSTNNKIYGGP